MSNFDDRSYAVPGRRMPSVSQPLPSSTTVPPVPTLNRQDRTLAETSDDRDLIESGEPDGETAQNSVRPNSESVRRQSDLGPDTDTGAEAQESAVLEAGEGRGGGLIAELEAQAECPNAWRHPIRFLGWAITMAFGIVTLILLLATIAAIPILNFIALGYLLEVEGRVARSGRLRDAFPLLPLAPRIGSIVLGVWIFLLPLRLIAWGAMDAHLISPGSAADIGWHRARNIAVALVAIHLCLAIARGGRLSCFFRPIKNLRWFWGQLAEGGYWERADQAVWEFTQQFRRGHYFWLGLRGWIGAFLWLLIPTLLFAAANRPDGFLGLITFIGGLMLAVLFTWIPFLQAHFAAENRLSAYLELGTIRYMWRRAPMTFALASIVTYALSLPLFLATIVLPPQDALWMVTPIFIVSIYPARVITAWAYAQAARREQRTWFSLRFLMSLVVMPPLMFYTLILFFTQFIGSSGKLVLFQHHALLLPRPF